MRRVDVERGNRKVGKVGLFGLMIDLLVSIFVKYRTMNWNRYRDPDHFFGASCFFCVLVVSFDCVCDCDCDCDCGCVVLFTVAYGASVCAFTAGSAAAAVVVVVDDVVAAVLVGGVS